MLTKPSMRCLAAALFASASIASTASTASGSMGPVEPVPASAETTPVAHRGDAADDPSIWVHPVDPSKSLLIGNDKQGALEVYNVDGSRQQRITTASSFWGNSDVRQRVSIGGNVRDVVAATNSGLRMYTVDRNSRTLRSITDGAGALNTGGGEGLCLYDSRATGALSAFVITRAGGVRQFRILDSDGDDRLEARLTRQFNLGSEAEGCVADDATGELYIAQEDVGLWRYGAEPGSGTARTKIDSVGASGHLAADVEGLALVEQGSGGYLIASAQNVAAPEKSYFTVYRRSTNAYVKSFRITAGTRADGCQRTDGIAAYAGSLGPAFPKGVFVCQDNYNSGPGSSGNQNFKLTRLERVVDLR